MFRTSFILIVSMLTIASVSGQSRQANFSGDSLGDAAEFMVSDWIVGPPVSVRESRGKVVVIEFFQLWCPGCKSFSIPTMKKWEKTFAREIAAGKLQLVSIHTVFEGHDFQTPERLRDFVAKTGFDHPVANDQQHENFHIPATMLAYGTRGTPEIAIVGKNGKRRFSHIGRFDVARAETFIRDLMAE